MPQYYDDCLEIGIKWECGYQHKDKKKLFCKVLKDWFIVDNLLEKYT